MKYSNNLIKNFSTYFLSAGIILFTAAGCGSSNESETAEVTDTDPVEQTADAQPENDQPAPEANDQTEMSEIETEQVVNTKPAINRDSEEFRKMKELRERNRNNEVLAGIDIKYGDWDTDSDNALNESEFFDGFYSVWDFDKNDVVSEEEFNKATENLFVNYEFSEYGEFADWDSDGNNELTKQEFTDGMVGVISTEEGQESANRLMTVWDLDNDEKIERIELSNIVILLDADDN